VIRAGLIAAAVLVAAGFAWVNLAPSDPARWHVDPTGGASTGRPNEARMVVATSLSPEAALAALTQAATAEPRVTVLAGGPAEGLVTYVQRSRIVGFPDYVSVRAEADGQGARLTFWSRSRFGHGDMGVNRARLERWTAALPGG
jgi:hypothetical protein